MNKITLLIAGLSVITVSQAQDIIDDFSIPYSSTVISGSVSATQAGTMLSGERDVRVRVINNPIAGQAARVTITGSQLSVISNDFLVRSTLELQYDKVGDETPGVNVQLNNGAGTANLLGGNTQVDVRFLQNDLDVDILATLRNQGSIIAQISRTRAGGSGQGTESFNFGPIAAQADSLTFTFGAQPSGDFALEGIEAVPEPATMTVLGLGLAAMMRRRRN